MIINVTLRLRGEVLDDSKKGPSHEETTQNALTMLPVGRGCSVGSLEIFWRKRGLYNILRLQEAVFSPLYFSSFLIKSLTLWVMCLSFSLILLSEQNISLPMVAVRLPVNS
jgi:hypothetical protein